jgi:transcriptional regulator with XRE-family HTH domain
MNMKVNEDKEMTTEKNNQSLAEFVAARRQSLGLTASEASQRAGLHRSYWGKLESGAYIAPAPSTLTKIARALEVPFEDLYALAGYDTPKGLPSFRPYLRTRYELPYDDIDKLESYFNFLRAQYGIPKDQPVFPPKPRDEEPRGEPHDQEDRRAA